MINKRTSVTNRSNHVDKQTKFKKKQSSSVTTTQQQQLTNNNNKNNNNNNSKLIHSSSSTSSTSTNKLVSNKRIASNQTVVKLPTITQLSQNPTPKTQNGYIIKKLIGQGAFAKVRVAERQVDGMDCVIKIYEKSKLHSESRREAIKKQINILKNINHPNVIQILDCYETPQTINIVMENFSHTSLEQFAKASRINGAKSSSKTITQQQTSPSESQPTIDPQVIKNIVKSIAQALVYLHECKITHRDLKPENVLINQKHQVKIIDLGLAMMGDFAQMTIAGTPQYMCPELVNKKHYCPYKADIWSFGIMLYWIVMGYFPQDNRKHQNEKKPNPKRIININNITRNNFIDFELQFPVDVHPGIEYLIERMLQKDPLERVDAKEILQDSWIKPRNLKMQIYKLTQKV